MESTRARILDRLVGAGFGDFIVGGRVVMFGRDCTVEAYKVAIRGLYSKVGERLSFCETLDLIYKTTGAVIANKARKIYK
jgi:hypothetical protein